MTSAIMPGASASIATSAQDPAGTPKTSAAASKFEAMMIGQMLQPMFDTVQEDKTFGGGSAEGMIKPMLITQYADLMEQKGGLGLDDAISQELAQTPGRGR